MSMYNRDIERKLKIESRRTEHLDDRITEGRKEVTLYAPAISWGGGGGA